MNFKGDDGEQDEGAASVDGLNGDDESDEQERGNPPDDDDENDSKQEEEEASDDGYGGEDDSNVDDEGSEKSNEKSGEARKARRMTQEQFISSLQSSEHFTVGVFLQVIGDIVHVEAKAVTKGKTSGAKAALRQTS